MTKVTDWVPYFVSKAGYFYVKVEKGHHLAPKSGRALLHRLVAEEMLGRRLRPGEEVHHKNGNKQDNRPENLEVCPSRHHHARLHATAPGVRRAPGEPNSRVDCECGCGKRIWKYDKGGALRRFSNGHARRRPTRMVLCKCGCGTFIKSHYERLRTGHKGNRRHYARGHNRRTGPKADAR